jgi:hypothetical protein
MSVQLLTLELEGITADDYLQWVRDPEPPALDHALHSVSAHADPLGTAIVATREWNGPAPEPALAAAGAGLPLTHGVRLGPTGPASLNRGAARRPPQHQRA